MKIRVKDEVLFETDEGLVEGVVTELDGEFAEIQVIVPRGFDGLKCDVITETVPCASVVAKREGLFRKKWTMR